MTNYIPSAQQKNIAARYRLTAILVGALGASSLLYIVVGWFFAPAMPPGIYAWLTPTTIVIAVLAAVVLLMILRRLILSPLRIKMAGQKGVSTVLSLLYVTALSGAILGDAVGVVGVIASLLTGVREFSLRLGIAALLMIAYSFPRRPEWERIIAFAIAEKDAEKNKEFPPKSDTLPADAVRLGLNDSE